AAFALTETPTLDLRTKNVMGILVPKIEAKAVRKTIDQRGYGIVGTSPRIDEAAEAYENLVEDVITAAEIETTMRRLIEEIEKVKRRVNALEYRVIPELKATEAFIRQRLEEMERDNFMRLKRFKST
ncbi:MAG: V-type ATP synthase subunit D, partial [Candidatus Thermoplasmatota archaeon]